MYYQDDVKKLKKFVGQILTNVRKAQSFGEEYQDLEGDLENLEELLGLMAEAMPQNQEEADKAEDLANDINIDELNK